MTTETMREAVARAFLLARGYPPETIDKDFPAIVKRYQEMCADWPDYYNAFSLVTDAFRDADISIRTVLERLREPTSVMVRAGGPHLWAGSRIEADAKAIDVWQAMLDAAAREVG